MQPGINWQLDISLLIIIWFFINDNQKVTEKPFLVA